MNCISDAAGAPPEPRIQNHMVITWLSHVMDILAQRRASTHSHSLFVMQPFRPAPGLTRRWLRFEGDSSVTQHPETCLIRYFGISNPDSEHVHLFCMIIVNQLL